MLIGMLMAGAIPRLPAQEVPLTPAEQKIMDDPRLFQYLIHSKTQSFAQDVLAQTGAFIPRGLTPEELLPFIRRLRPSQVEQMAGVMEEEWWNNPGIGFQANENVRIADQARADKNNLKKKIVDAKKAKGKMIRRTQDALFQLSRAKKGIRDTQEKLSQERAETLRLRKVVSHQKIGIGGAMLSGALISWILFGRPRGKRR
jgi:hypothetical protein